MKYKKIDKTPFDKSTLSFYETFLTINSSNVAPEYSKQNDQPLEPGSLLKNQKTPLQRKGRGGGKRICTKWGRGSLQKDTHLTTTHPPPPPNRKRKWGGGLDTKHVSTGGPTSILTSNKRVDVVTMIQLYLKSQQDYLTKRRSSDIRVSIVGTPFILLMDQFLLTGTQDNAVQI